MNIWQKAFATIVDRLSKISYNLQKLLTIFRLCRQIFINIYSEYTYLVLKFSHFTFILKDIKKVIKSEPEDKPAEPKVEVKHEPMEEDGGEPKPAMPLLLRPMKEELQELQTENKRLHNLVTELHQRHHQQTLQVKYVCHFD